MTVLATDPPVSENQRRAMFAAREGRSTLGIPKKVGEEFVGKDGAPCAAGVLYVAPDGDVLLLRRSSTEANYAGHWALPGGKAEEGESPDVAADRESAEEIGFLPRGGEKKIIDRVNTPNGMVFHTYAQPVAEKFAPRLNSEHSGYAWAPLDMLPQPIHPSIRRMLDERLGITADMTPEDWTGLRGGFAKWTREEAAEGEHAEDDAQFNESDHPRDHGKFATSAGSSGGSEKEPKRPKAASIAAIAKHATATREFLKGKTAGEIVAAVASHHKLQHAAKEAVVFGINSLIAHGSQMHGSFQDSHVEEMVSHVVHNFSTVAAISIAQGREVMRSVVKGLIAKRAAGARDDAEDDGVLDALHAVLDLLSGDDDDQAQDAALAFDRMPPGVGPASRLGLAFDRASVRTLDRDGRLHVEITNISKACVNPYVGREIPDWEKLGLDPDRVYKLYRDPDELAKAAPTFNNVPLLSRHVAVTADDHQPDLVIGSTGTDASFELPYLRNSLVVWAKSGIEDIESDAKKELSSAYRYRADMMPGTFDGDAYDGIMRDIIGNHVALVKEGRAGADVVVGDSNEEIKMAAKAVILTRKAAMTLGGVLSYVKPKIAADAKLDFSLLSGAVDGLTSKNFKDKKAAIAAGVRKMVTPHLAKDASLNDVEKVLDMLEAHEPAERGTADAMETDPNSGMPIPGGGMTGEDEHAGIKNFLKEKGMADDDISTACGMLGKKAATDEDPEEKKKREDKEAAEKAAKDSENPFAKKDEKKDEGAKDMVTKPAMDAAIDAATKATEARVLQTQRDIRDAERAVRPFVGELAMAFDSAEQVYRTALKTLGVEGVDAIHASALPTILKMQQPAGKRPAPVIAQDAATQKSFAERYPDVGRIGVA